MVLGLFSVYCILFFEMKFLNCSECKTKAWMDGIINVGELMLMTKVIGDRIYFMTTLPAQERTADRCGFVSKFLFLCFVDDL